jgi:large subunit ribosomal protein L4
MKNTMNVLNWEGQSINQIEIPLFLQEEENYKLVNEVYHQQMANRRQATYGTKSRGELSFSKKKLWQQKRTGRARIGSRGAPHHRKGGVCFGPDGRIYETVIPKKKLRKSLFVVLSSKFNKNNLFVLNDLQLNEVKTKGFCEKANLLNLKSALWIDNDKNDNLYLSLRNVIGMNFMPINGINTLDALKAKNIVFSLSAFNKLGELYEKI